MAGVATGSADDAKEQIRARADLLEIVREYVQPLRPVGRQFTGLCPFHSENTPSFRVTPQTQTWHCFGCDQGGDVFDFIERVEKTDFRGALEFLADRTGVELVKESAEARRRSELRKRVVEANRVAQKFYEYLLWDHEAGKPGRELLERRGVGQEVARRFGLGFAPAAGRALTEYLRSRNLSLADAAAAALTRPGGGDFFRERLIVPIRDERGAPVAFVGRTAGDDPRKYVNSPETPAYSKGKVIFALDLAKDGIGKRGHAVLMEGQFDVIVAHQFGVDNAIATSGTALTEDQLRLLKRFTEELVLCFDSDEAGHKAALRAVELAAAVGLRTRVLSLGGGAKDPDEFLRGGGDWPAALEAALPGWDWFIRQAIEGLNPSRPADLDRALDRVFEVLEKIADPALREAYRLKSAEWLGIESRLLTRAAAPARPARRPAAGGDPGPEPPGRPAPVAPTRPRRLTVAETVLVLLAAQPDLLEPLARRLDAADMPEPERDLYLKMSGTLRAGGLEGLREALGSFDNREQELIRRAWAQPLPPAAEEDLDRLAHAVRVEVLQAARQNASARLAEAEQRGDRDHIALFTVEVGRLDRELEALKNSVKGKSIVG